MARSRWTIPLILISLPILATVITAFRVRDPPKGALESDKFDFKKLKCDDCEVSELGNKINSAKIEGAKRSYDDMKKAVREKISVSKSSVLNKEDDDDDDGDEGTVHFKNKKHPEPVKHKDVGSSEKLIFKSRISISLEDDDDDDDDDEDDDDDDDNKKTMLLKKQKEKKQDIKPSKVSQKSKQDVQKSKPVKLKDDSDDEEDDIDDDGDKNYVKSEKKSQLKSKSDTRDKSNKQIKKTQSKDYEAKDDDDDDEDDDDDIDEDKISSLKNEKKPAVVTEKAMKSQKDIKTDIPELKEIKKSDSKHEGETKNEKKIEISKLHEKPKIEIKKQDLEIKPKTDTKNKITDNPVRKESKPENKETLKPVPEKPKKEIKKEDPPKSKQPEKVIEKPKHHDAKSDHHPEPKKVEKKTESKEIDEKPKPKAVESKKEIKIDVDHKKNIEKDPRKSDKTSKHLDGEELHSKSESHLKHMTDALNRKNLLRSEFEDYYAFFPTFAPNFSRIHNPECRRHGQILLRQLRGTKLWALNMLDSTAKIPSGILQGNSIQLGDFDQCLASRARVQLDTGSVVKVQGKYCLAQVEVKAEHPELELPVHLAQAKNLIRSRIDDPGHFVPRFSTLSWGVCVPAACDPEDVVVVIKDALRHYQHTSGVHVKIKVDEIDCHTEDHGDWWENWLELPTVLTLSFYGVIILLVIVATAQDYFAGRNGDDGKESEESDEKAECDQKETEEEENKEEDLKKTSDGFLISFSLYRTISKLVAPASTDEISCIHGVRALASIALLVFHKFLPIAVTPYTNRLRITELSSSPLLSWWRAGWVFTDCFLLLSGTLTAHRISADSGAAWRLYTRYLRLTPALLALMLFYSYVWDLTSEGPMWGSLITKNAEVCQEGWWWNLLYIQNYFGFEEICAPQTHQLALDMQLTILGGMIIWLSQVKPGVTKMVIPGLHILSAYSRYTTVRDHRLTMLAYHGVSVSQLYRTARLSYTSTFHRSTAYLVGLTLGLALQKPSQHNKFVVILGWLVSSTLWALVWWAGMDSGSITYRYHVTFAAQYAALAPIAASVAIAWFIYAVHNGYSAFLSRLLCSQLMVVISRLSYALYLCQFVVFLTNAATVRTSREFSLMSLIDLQEISMIIISSTILTLTFVLPMQNLHKLFVLPKFESKKEEEETEDSESKAKEKQQELEEFDQEQREEEIEEVAEEQEEVPRRHQNFMAHREVLEEISEAEVEYEMQRDRVEGLEEILEEEEDDQIDEEVGDEEVQNRYDNNELEVIEEEQGGEDDFWGDRDDDYVPRRAYPTEDDDLQEWEWTSTDNDRNGAQHHRYTR